MTDTVPATAEQPLKDSNFAVVEEEDTSAAPKPASPQPSEPAAPAESAEPAAPVAMEIETEKEERAKFLPVMSFYSEEVAGSGKVVLSDMVIHDKLCESPEEALEVLKEMYLSYYYEYTPEGEDSKEVKEAELNSALESMKEEDWMTFGNAQESLKGWKQSGTWVHNAKLSDGNMQCTWSINAHYGSL